MECGSVYALGTCNTHGTRGQRGGIPAAGAWFYRRMVILWTHRATCVEEKSRCPRRAGSKAMSATLLTAVTEFLAAAALGENGLFSFTVSKRVVHLAWQWEWLVL